MLPSAPVCKWGIGGAGVGGVASFLLVSLGHESDTQPCCRNAQDIHAQEGNEDGLWTRASLCPFDGARVSARTRIDPGQGGSRAARGSARLPRSGKPPSTALVTPSVRVTLVTLSARVTLVTLSVCMTLVTLSVHVNETSISDGQQQSGGQRLAPTTFLPCDITPAPCRVAGETRAPEVTLQGQVSACWSLWEWSSSRRGRVVGENYSLPGKGTTSRLPWEAVTNGFSFLRLNPEGPLPQAHPPHTWGPASDHVGPGSPRHASSP